jgi:TonB-dependent SusC/RagA subfamily outer membrane receptor
MRYRRVIAGFATAASLLLSPAGGSAIPISPNEEIPEVVPLQGNLAVTVTDSRNGQPLAATQVSIQGTGIGGLTDASGRITLANVPAGARVLQVQRLGYRTVEREVQVVGGDTQQITIPMVEQALALDAVVVTGTAGGTQRRAIGNVVDRISAADVNTVAPVTNVSQLIGGRSPGVTMLAGAGQVGSGQRIRIRGTGSIGLDNDPIVYIDGVRMDSRANRGISQRGGASVSRLNDLDPETIESIEIIKGPAAATLYGTEASNGVIQIITKRGTTGAPTFDVSIRHGYNWLWDPAGRHGLRWGVNPNTGEVEGFNLYEYERDFGNGPIFTYGAIQSYNMSLAGGSDAVRYFVSANRHDETGVISWNWDKRTNVQANLDVRPSETVSIKTSMGYTEGERRLAQSGLTTDPFGNLYWSTPANLNTTRGWRQAPPEEYEKVEDKAGIDRFTGSFEIQHIPTTWFVHRLVTGVDANQELFTRLFPRMPEGNAHFFGALGLGDKEVIRVQNRFVTFDYGASATFDLADELRSVTSAGFQYYRTRSLSLGATASNFPAIPITTITGGSTRNGTESFVENATVGVYLQQQMEWRNRVFLTGAVRLDDNSAFGTEFDAAIYPKVSGTWVMHEEPFWNLDWVNQFRLRGAWGAAGQQPGTFDASRLYAPQIGYQDQPGLVPSAFGNPALKPERGEEIEVGFDSDFLDGRLSFVYTRFERWTRDAIVSRGIPRSQGFPGGQIVNIGLVRGWGNEFSIDASMINHDRFSWDLGVQIGNFKNRIDDLGDETVIGTGQVQQRVGFSIGDLYMKRVISAEINAAGNITSALCDGGTGPSGVAPGGQPVPCATAPLVWWGHTQPTWDLGINNTFAFGPFRVFARIEGAGGNYQEDSSGPAAITSVGVMESSIRRDDPIVAAYRTFGRSPLGTYNAGFARLREVSLTYTLPSMMAARLGANRGSVSIAGRNMLMLWTAQEGFNTPRSGQVFPDVGDAVIWDVETRGTGDLSSGYQTVMPPMANAVVTVRLSF